MTHLRFWFRRGTWLALGVATLLNGMLVVSAAAPVSAHTQIQEAQMQHQCLQVSGRHSFTASVDPSPGSDAAATTEPSTSSQATPNPEAPPTSGWQDCGTTGATILYLSVKDCPQVPCILRRGTDAAITVRFRALVDTAVATVVVHGRSGIFSIPLKVPESDACKAMIKPSCPIKAGQEYTIGGAVPVLKDYPQITGTIRLELQDANNQDLLCIELPAEIQ
jgi:Niemann-Pick C2 protein